MRKILFLTSGGNSPPPTPPQPQPARLWVATDLVSNVYGGQYLEGYSNYHLFVRDFKAAAQRKDLWKVFTGEYAILPFPASSVVLASSRIQHELFLPNSQDDAKFEAYNINQKKVQKALGLLASWVHPAIRAEIQDIDNPKAAWDHLKDTYKLSNDVLGEISLHKLNNIRLVDYKSASDYINAFKLAIHNWIDAGVEDTTEAPDFYEIVMKSLPTKWQRESMNLLSRRPGSERHLESFFLVVYKIDMTLAADRRTKDGFFADI